MNRKYVKISSLIISATFAFSMLSGCGKAAETTTAQAATQAVTGTQQAEDKPIYPLQTDVTLKYWVPLPMTISANYKNLGDTPFSKELEKKTGVKVEYLHPAIGQEKDSFNILIASADLPDMMEYTWGKDFPGGPEAAIQNNIILKLNDTLQNNAPNLTSYLNANGAVNKMVKTDNGSYYGFPFIRGDESLMVFYGLAVRNDWLKDLGLQVPATIDEWYEVLKAFKEKKGANAAFSYAGSGLNPFLPFDSGVFIGAYGIKKDFYKEDGEIKFGPYEAGYKDWLATMAKWYKEGLLDKNFATLDGKGFDASFVGGNTGATALYAGSGLSKYIPALKEKDANADLVAAPYPVLTKGATPMMGQKDNPYNGITVAVAASSKNVDVAEKWLDYNYSEEGTMLNNFGIEGVSYNMVNNYPEMADEVLKNANNLPVVQAWSQYARATGQGPLIQRKEYIEQYYALPQQQDALKVWGSTDAANYNLPPLTPTQDESTQYAKIINDVNTYVNEYTLKVIMGSDTTDNFDKYIEQLKKLNIDKAIEIQQSAYDRYDKR